MENTSQIISKLKPIYDTLLETIHIFQIYFKDGNLPSLKVERLKELTQKYDYTLYEEIISPILLDKQLTNNVVDAVFNDLFGKSLDLFDVYNLEKYDKKFNEYKVKIIQIGNDIDFYLNAIECLRYNLQNLHIFFTSYGIPSTDKWSIEKYGINLDFHDLLLEALNIADLSKRKELILKKLHSAELYKLQDIVEKEDYDEFDEFIDKCQKAIESINFQINSSSPAAVVTLKPKPHTIIDEIKELEDRENSLEYKAKIEEEYNSFNRKLTNKEIELVRNDCMALNDVFVRGLDIYETFFSSGTIIAENLEYLKTYPFTGLLSNNYFKANVFGSFDDDVTIGTILELCFSDTIKRIQTLDFTFNSTTDLNKEPKLKELIKTILKNNIDPVLLKDNLLQFAEEIRELINLVKDFTANEIHPSDANSEILNKNNNLLNKVLEKEDYKISTEQIIESGFVRAFIEEYHEEKIHSYYPDKDRLLYIMCRSHIEKLEVTKKQIETIKSEIHKLGREELSFAYLQSSKPESGPNFIKANQRIEFWLCKSAEDFIEEEYSFCPTYDTLSKLNDDSEFKKKLSFNNGEFWNLIHKDLKPKNQNFMLEDLVELEIDLVNQIEDDINNYNENGSWEIDFDEYEKHIESNRAIEDLFNISELFVQLNRLQMFQELLQIPAQNEEKKIIHKQTHNNKKEISLSDFLYNKSDFDKLIKIQDEFRTYDGKRMAILIHILQNEYRILNIISKSKTHSRKHFICLFKEDNSFDKTYAINKYIDPFSNKLNLTTAYEFDADYVDVKEKLTKIIENPVV